MSRPRGHVRRRGERWVVVIELGTDPATGQRRQKWHSGYESKAAAEKARTEILASFDVRAYVAPEKLTIANFLHDEWLPTKERTLRPTTLSLYRTIIDAYIVPRIGAVRLQGLEVHVINRLYADLLAGGRRDGRGLAPKTVRNAHTLLHKALDDAVRWGLLPRNPAERADPPRGRRGEIRTWDLNQTTRFLEHVAEDRLSGLYRLLLTTGMRRSEALGLPWRSVDLDGSALSVEQTLVMVDSVPTLTPYPKTNSSRRQVWLDAETVAELRKHRARQASERLAWGEGYRDHGLVFSREDGRPLNPPQFTRRFQRLCGEASVPVIGVHGLRHTSATLALRAGTHPKTVADRLGHSGIGITLDLYSHAVPALEREATETLAGLLSGRG